MTWQWFRRFGHFFPPCNTVCGSPSASSVIAPCTIQGAVDATLLLAYAEEKNVTLTNLSHILMPSKIKYVFQSHAVSRLPPWEETTSNAGGCVN